MWRGQSHALNPKTVVILPRRNLTLCTLFPLPARLRRSYAGAALQADMRAEVGLVSSSIIVTSPDGAAQAAEGGEKFGPHLLAGESGLGQALTAR